MRSMGPVPTLSGCGAIICKGSCSPRNVTKLCLGKAGEGISFKKGGFFLASVLYQRQAVVTLFSRVLLLSSSRTFVSQGFSIKKYKTLKTLRFQFIYSGVCREGLVKVHSPKWPKITM